MASTPPPTAVSKVLSTFELIENILLFLPLRQLLLAQRINKATFDVIAGSADIRCALFFKASSPALQSFVKGPRAGLSTVAGTGWRESEHAKSIRPIVNPFLKVRRIGASLDIEDAIEEAIRGGLSMLFTTGSGVISGFACYRERTDVPLPVKTRDDMLMTHPPVGKLLLEDTDDGHRVTVGSDSGTTYGEVYKYGCSRWEGIYRDLLEEVKRGELKRNEVIPAIYEVDQAVTWKRLDHGVDKITGHEMLAILSGEPEELETGAFDDDSDVEDSERDEESDPEEEYYDTDDEMED